METFYAQETKHQLEEWIFINRNIKEGMVGFRGDSSRVASRPIKINTKYYLQVVRVSAPASTYKDEEVEDLAIS